LSWVGTLTFNSVWQSGCRANSGDAALVLDYIAEAMKTVRPRNR
jgi:hypothetical protein